jgi:hypothetical protein
MRFKFALAALAASAAFASPAMAQTSDTANATARGTVLRPLSVTEDEVLDFGTVLQSGATGWVDVAAEDGVRTYDTLSGVTLIPLDNGSRGVFTVTNTVGQSVDLTVVPPTILVGPGGAQVDVLDFRLDGLPAGGVTDTRVTGASGVLVVGVGGRFEIDALQPNGVYTANYTFTAEY